jgi:acyl-coenzyme A thioesterase PaaI-like protein
MNDYQHHSNVDDDSNNNICNNDTINNIYDDDQHQLEPTNMTELYGERMLLPEWDDDDNNNNTNSKMSYRKQNGWVGNDLIHSKSTSNVYIYNYYVKYGTSTGDSNDSSTNSTTTAASTSTTTDTYISSAKGGIGTTLTGYVHFTKNSESHNGYCHGGSTCSVMDDVIGWTSFCVTGIILPWSGYTVQVNTSLCKPIPINTYLYISGTITNIVRRKVYVSATLYDIQDSTNDHNDSNNIANTDHSCDTISSINSNQEVQQQQQQSSQVDANTITETNGECNDNNNLPSIQRQQPQPQQQRIIYATCEGIVVMNKGILPNH